MPHWIAVQDRLPADGQRCLCHLPKNDIYLPGKTGAVETRPVVILRFMEDYFVKNASKTGHQGSPHFWLGEGSSNKFFAEVSHWMALPEAP